MTIVIRRSVGALVGLSVAALLLSACSSGPSQVGQAVIVGSDTVSVDTVQQELNNLLATQTQVQQAQQQGKLDQASRAIVTTDVLHLLINNVAQRDGLSVTDQQVDQFIATNGGVDKISQGLLTDSGNTRQAVKDLLLEVKLATKFADTLTVNFGYVVAPDRATALQYANKIAADPGALNGLVQQANAAAQAAGQQGGGGSTSMPFSVSAYIQGIAQQAQQAQSQGQQAPSVNDSPVFGTPVNNVVAFQPSPAEASSWIVALIKSRDPNGAKAPATGSVADLSDLTTLQQIGISLLQPEVNQIGVRVSPRYGVWDTVGMQVAPSADQTIGVVIPVNTHPVVSDNPDHD